MHCKNDYLIEELIKCPRHKIKSDGRVFTNLPEKGHISIKVDWREKYYKVSKDGYKCVRFKGKYLHLHRIIYAKFNGKLNSSKDVNHEDGNPSNNRADNLTLMSKSKNILHSYNVLNRVINRGARKFTSEEAIQIRLANEAGRSMRLLAEDYGVAKSTISYIVNNKTYAK